MKIGRVRIAREKLRLNPECAALFAQLVVVRAELLWHRDTVDYMALCDAFADIDDNDDPPEYRAIFHRSDDGRPPLVEFVRLP